MRTALIAIGILLVLVGLFWPWLSRIPLGRLPGDIIIDRPNFKLVFPVVSMFIVSIVLSIILWLFRK